MIAWIRGVVEDPKTKNLSSTRLCALVFGAVGCFIAVTSPENAETVAALIGGGSVALLVRTKPEE